MIVFTIDIHTDGIDLYKLEPSLLHSEDSAQFSLVDWSPHIIRILIILKEHRKFRDWDTLELMDLYKAYVGIRLIKGTIEADISWDFQDVEAEYPRLLHRALEIISGIGDLRPDLKAKYHGIAKWLFELRKKINQMMPGFVTKTKKQRDMIEIMRETGSDESDMSILASADLLIDRGYEYLSKKIFLAIPPKASVKDLEDFIKNSPPGVSTQMEIFL